VFLTLPFHKYSFGLAFIILIFSPALLGAQVNMSFDGLARTQVQYLTARIPGLTAGNSQDSTLHYRTSSEIPLLETLERLRQNLVNLPALQDAAYELYTNGTDTTVRWSITESRTLFPVVNLGGIKGNFFYQVGFRDSHWRGLGQELAANYQNNDGEHNFYFSLRNAAYRGSRWGYGVEFRRYAALEPLSFPEGPVTYRYANLSIGFDLSYTFRPRHRLTLGISTFTEDFLKRTESSPGPDQLRQQKGLLRFHHQVNRLDYHGPRLSGTDHQTIGQAVFNPGGQPAFLIGWHDFRWFQLIGQRGNLATRLRSGLSSNIDSPFAPFVLDSQINIRGSGNRIDRGTAQLLLNLEYRHVVWSDKDNRFSAQLVGFSDLGTWRKPGGDFRDLIEGENIRHFVGAGIRLISHQSNDTVIRVDYGKDILSGNQRGIVVGLGQYF
jgi:outer membrane protein assembly factor BamA